MAAMGIGVSCSCGFGASVPEATRRVTAEEAGKQPETQRQIQQIAQAARVTEAERTAAPAFWLGLTLLVTGNLRLISVAKEQVKVQHGKDNLEAIHKHLSHYRGPKREAWKDDAGYRNALDNTE